MTSNIEALNKLVEDAMSTERELIAQQDALAAQNKEFASYLKAKKHQDDQLKVLWEMVKEEMEEEGLSEYEIPDVIKLSLSPSGKFRLIEGVEIDDIPDELCEIKKTLSNSKVKASLALTGELPEGIESTGNILRKKIL